MELQKLIEKKSKLIEYINHGHHVEIDKLNTSEGIEFINAKMAADKKLAEAQETFERSLMYIQSTFPCSHDIRRIIKEKTANSIYENQKKEAMREYIQEKIRIHSRTIRLIEIEKLELKYAKANLVKITEEINKQQSSQSKKKPQTM